MTDLLDTRYPVRDAAAALVAARHPDGGWGWHAGNPANTECTALAVLALRAGNGSGDASAALQSGVAWLRSRQHADGSWPLGDQVRESSWASGLAAIALHTASPRDPHAVRGGEWLLERESASYPWLQRLWLRLFPAARVADQDATLLGWPWAEGTSAWVEPTVWGLLAVKLLRPGLPSARAAERIGLAERMLADRMCVGGGWNYGNKIVMGVELPPYPDTTALSLLALQDARSAEVTGVSIARLRELTAGRNSVLVLALTTLALQLHGEDVRSYRDALTERAATSGLGSDTRALALAVLALDAGTLHFHVGRHA